MQRDKPGRLGSKRLAVWALIGGCSLAGTASAAPVQTAWSTYLRSGPGATYQVIDELEHGVVVDVQRCDDHWCRIQDGRSVGYIDKDALTLPKPPAAQNAASRSESCIVAGQVSYRQADQTRFCGPAPVDKPPVR